MTSGCARWLPVPASPAAERIRLLLRLRVLPVAAALVSAACLLGQTEKPEPAAAPSDPYTGGDEKVMAELGYVSFGPFVWADDHDTRAIEQTIGGNRLRWLETTHFRIGSMLGEMAMPKDKKPRKKLDAELKELRARLAKVPAQPRALDPWLRLHLLAHRLEGLYADLSERLGVTDADFPKEPPRELPLDYRGEGPYLGQRGKYLVLVVDKPGALARYMTRFAGVEGSGEAQRFNFMISDSLFTGVSVEQTTGDKLDDAQLHSTLVFNVTNNLIDGYEHYWYRLPAWLSEGIAHWFARRAWDEFGSFSGMSEREAGRAKEWNWPPKVRARVRHGAFEPAEKLLAVMDPGKLSLVDHMTVWSRIDFLLSRGDEPFAKFMAAMKGRIPMVGVVPTEAEIQTQQTAALQAAFGFDFAAFDSAWTKWVLATYPQK